MFDVTAFLDGLAAADGSPGGDLCKPVNGVELPADGLRWPVASAARPDGLEVGPDRPAACGDALDGNGPRPLSNGGNGRGVPSGWTAGGWRRRLRYVADCCQELHPARAAELRGMAAALDGDERKPADGT